MSIPAYIFDTSPLITLAGTTVDGQPAIEHILPSIRLFVVETVAQEATANPSYPDARVVQALLDGGRIVQLPVPITPVDTFINAYPKWVHFSLLGTSARSGRFEYSRKHNTQ